jgi:hypothetical protein
LFATLLRDLGQVDQFWPLGFGHRV